MGEPLFKPSSTWTPPKEFPRLENAKILGLDTETFDPDLTSKGPAWTRGQGKIIGVSLSDGKEKWYFPVAHDGGGNMDKDQVFRYLDDVLSTDIPKVGANIQYDLEWLRYEGVKYKGPFIDTQIAEPLLDEEKPGGYSLQNLSQYYLGLEKEEGLLEEAAMAYGVDPKGEMTYLHSKYVGPYAEIDALRPIQIWQHQKKLLTDAYLTPTFEMESKLIPILIDMRFLGVRIDEEAAEVLALECMREEERILAKIKELSGVSINPWQSKHIVRVCNDNSIDYPFTSNGNPSITGDWLKNSSHPFLNECSKYRVFSKMRRDFIQGVILDQSHNGRIHAQFHQLRKDSGGTRSGRFSSSNPNLQQIPSRHPYWGPAIRGLFIPESSQTWARFDYAQQEPRVLVHYASELKLKGALEAQREYIKNPLLDYHTLTQEEVKQYRVISRFQAKTINLGMSYGMGVPKLANQMGIIEGEANQILEAYHETKPYVRQLRNACTRRVKKLGMIKTILGRFRHFKDRDKAYMAINALIQGSSADITKQAMIDCYEAGYTPHLQVHDELDFSLTDPNQGVHIKKMMENCVKLNVPLIVDAVLGDNWGECK